MFKKKPKIEFDLSQHTMPAMPNSVRLENAVLGCLITLNGSFIHLALRLLNVTGMFHNILNETIWKEILYLHSKSIEISISNLIDRFKILGNKDADAQVYEVCSSGFLSNAEFEKSCLILNEFWIQRTLLQYGYNIHSNALRTDIDALDLLGEASDTLGLIFLHIAKMKEKTLSDGIKDLAATIVNMGNDATLSGIKSSIPGLNRVIRGYRKGNLIIIGASTHEGKTTLALQETRYCIEQGIPVGYLTLEMSQVELLLMMSCDAANVPLERVFDNTASADEMLRLGNYMERLKKMPLYIVDKPGLRISEIKAIGRNWKKNNGIQLLVIDLLHLAYDDVDSNSPEQRFTNIANGLKELAKELEIPIIALSHLARKDQSEKKQPHEISHLKYASGIEQAADVILLIYRPELHGIDNFPDGVSTEGFARIIVGKLRLIKKQNVSCRFLGTRFADWDEQYKVNHPYKPYAGMNNMRQLPKEEDAPF